MMDSDYIDESTATAEQSKANATISEASPYNSFTALRSEHSELLQSDSEGENAESYLLKVEEFISRGRATGALISADEERRASQSMLNYWVTVLYRANRKPANTKLADYDPGKTPDLGEIPCPYPGVRPFRSDESKFFFGRRRQIDYMLNRLREDRLMVVVGPSGIGKTSLVQAGLLPALQKDNAEGVQHLFLAPVFPGENPFANLMRTINKGADETLSQPPTVQAIADREANDVMTTNAAATTSEGATTNTRTDDAATVGATRDARSNGELAEPSAEELFQRPPLLFTLRRRNDVPVVIFIDNFEEVFTLCRDRDGRADFINNLLTVIKSQDARHIVILAMSDDDYGNDLEILSKEFAEYFERSKLLLSPPNANELREAIERPAELVYLQFEEPLTEKAPNGVQSPPLPPTSEMKNSEPIVQSIIKEISSEPVGFPLLQFTLSKLYEKRQGHVIPYSAFARLGSCRKALGDTAESFYANLSSSKQRTAGRLLRRMIRLDSALMPSVRAVRRKELSQGELAGIQTEEVLAELVKEQLVRVTPGATPAEDRLEITHRALFSNWKRMAEWVLNKQNQRYWKRLGLAVSLLLVGLAILYAGAVAWGGRRDRDLSNRLAQYSDQELNKNRLDRALVLGKKAYEIDNNNPAARGNLLRLLHVLQFSPRPVSFLSRNNLEVGDMALDGEGKKLAVVDSNGDIYVWDVVGGKIAKDSERRLASDVTLSFPLILSADGSLLAAVSGMPNQVVIWNLTDHNSSPIRKLDLDGNSFITALSFRPHTHELGVATFDGIVSFWDVTSGAKNAEFNFKDSLNSIAFSPDGSLLAVGDRHNSVTLRQLVGRAPDRILTEGGETKKRPEVNDKPIYNLAFGGSGEGLELAAGCDDNLMLVWSLEENEPVRAAKRFYGVKMDKPMIASFSRLSDKDTRTLVAGFNTNGNLYVWNFNDGSLLSKQTFKPTYPVNSIAFNGNGNMVATPGDDGLILWDITKQNSLFGGNGLVAFDPTEGSKSFASVYSVSSVISDAVWLRDSESPLDSQGSGNEILLRPNQTEESADINSLAYSPGGKLVASGMENGQIILLDTSTLQQDGEPLLSPDTRGFKVYDLAFSHDGKTLAAVMRADEPPVAEATAEATAESAGTTPFQSEGVEATAMVQPDRVVVWDVEGRRQIQSLPAGKGEKITSVAFSADDRALATGHSVMIKQGAQAGFVSVWDVRTWKAEKTQRKETSVESVAFSGNGKLLAAGTGEGNIDVYQTASLKQKADWNLEGLNGLVTHVAFSPDSSILATVINRVPKEAFASRADGTDTRGVIMLWNVGMYGDIQQIGDPLISLEGPIRSLSFSADGRWLASGEVKHIVLWNIDINEASVKYRFCEIVDCERPDLFEDIKGKESFSQSLYRSAPTWLKELMHQYVYR